MISSSNLIPTLLILIPLLATGTPTPKEKFSLLIDAGHGGVDVGASRGPASEATLSLKIAQKLQALAQDQLEIKMTRDNDKTLSLQRRADMANESQAQMMISLHLNTNPDTTIHGMEIYFENILPADEESLYLANLENKELEKTKNEDKSFAANPEVTAITKDLMRGIKIFKSSELAVLIANQMRLSGIKNQVKQAPFYVLNEAQIPALLIEVGYISNPAEQKKLLDSKYQDKIAQNIYKSIIEYTKKYPSSPKYTGQRALE